MVNLELAEIVHHTYTNNLNSYVPSKLQESLPRPLHIVLKPLSMTFKFSLHLTKAVEFKPDGKYLHGYPLALHLVSQHQESYVDAFAELAEAYRTNAERNKKLSPTAKATLDMAQIEAMRDEALLKGFRKEGIADLYLSAPEVIAVLGDPIKRQKTGSAHPSGFTEYAPRLKTKVTVLPYTVK